MLGSEQHGLNAANGLNAIDSIVRQTAGNKDTIKRLIQTGAISEMQGVLAGMRADEISKAGMLNKGNMPTVAQQVLSPQSPQSMAPPAPPQMGVPSAPPPMPPQAPQDMQAPQGMADGGLAALPVPDDMFNSAVGDSDTQQYAPGGIVAFANGGGAHYNSLDEAWQRVKRLEGGLGPHGEMRVSSAGAVGPAQLMPTTAPEAARMAGLQWDERRYRTDPDYNEALGKAYYASRVAARHGDYAKAALDYHSGMGNVDKGNIGPAGRQYAKDFGGSGMDTGPMARQAGDNPTAVPDIASIAENFGLFQNIVGKKPTKATDALLASVNISPEQEKKDKDRDLGYALLAASQAFSRPGPFLSNVTGALGAMAEPLQEGEKSRKAEKLAGLKAAAEAENEDYQDRRSLLSPAAALYAEQMRGREAALGRKQQGEQFTEQMRQRGLDRTSAETMAKIRLNPSDQEGAIALLLRDNPGWTESDAYREYLKLKKENAPSYMPGVFPGDTSGGTDSGAPAGPWSQYQQ
jgi:hypothetical protein